ncbi:MAG: hypothetical protein ACRECF_04435 [Methyloceanibacter sp.]
MTKKHRDQARNLMPEHAGRDALERNSKIKAGPVPDLSVATETQAIEARNRIKAETMFALEQHGALYRYVLDKREEAVDAMMAFAAADPANPHQMFALQKPVLTYLDVCHWILSTLEEEPVPIDDDEPQGEEEPPNE